MGTHPIFESDFDCLTEIMNSDNPIPIIDLCHTDSDNSSDEDEEVAQIENLNENIKIEPVEDEEEESDEESILKKLLKDNRERSINDDRIKESGNEGLIGREMRVKA